MQTFAHISSHEWRFSLGLDERRREALSRDIGFELIIGMIEGQALVASHGCERLPHDHHYRRAIVTLKLNSHTTDLFYNSASGYRAQYYQAIQTGERANTYAVQQLWSTIKDLYERPTSALST